MRLLLAAVLLTAALPASASPPDVRVVHGAPTCQGQVLVVGPHHASCTHRDLYRVTSDVPFRASAPPTAPVPCYGDGTTGPRVQLIYGYVEGRPDRTATVVRSARQEVVPRIEAVVRAASGGRDLGLRFVQAAGCGPVSVPTVRLPRAVASGTPEQRFARVVEALQDTPYTRQDRKYLVLLDDRTEDAVCGMGELQPTMDQPRPANPHDGVPTAGARTDLLSALGGPNALPLPRYAVAWRGAYGAKGVDCTQLGPSHVEVQLHEVFHTLGAVQLSAPHSDGGGHCTDTPSLMCPAGKRATVASCGAQRVQVLDCGMDDFWNPAPAPGSYLDSSANVADSSFFGPQPQDQLAGAPV